MREVLAASPRRGPKDQAAIIAVQNFKGGVGKSTITTHLAHYLAIQGYRGSCGRLRQPSHDDDLIRLQSPFPNSSRGDSLPPISHWKRRRMTWGMRSTVPPGPMSILFPVASNFSMSNTSWQRPVRRARVSFPLDLGSSEKVSGMRRRATT